MQNLLRIPKVTAATGLTRSTIYEKVSEGTFPAPVKITARASAWVESEVQEWIENRIADRTGESAAHMLEKQGDA